MRLTRIEKIASGHLGTPVIVAQALEAIDLSHLTGGERRQLDGMRFAQRRRDWLAGRRALKTLLRSLGRSEETSSLSFPNRQLSLTHAEGTSLAVGTVGACAGIGVDYEPLRDVDERIGRWFLNAHEAEWVKGQPESDRHAHLIRLWTIKEAAFKSCQDNDRLMLQELAIRNPGTTTSLLVSRGEDLIRVYCSEWLSGYLSIALFEGAQ